MHFTCIFACHGTMHFTCIPYFHAMAQCMTAVLPSCPKSWHMFLCLPDPMHGKCIFAVLSQCMPPVYLHVMAQCMAPLFICLPVPLDACRMYIDLPVLSIQSSYMEFFLDILSSGMTISSMLNDLPVSCLTPPVSQGVSSFLIYIF